MSSGVVAIIQARMGSSRLPGKVMMDLGGAPVIERVLRRVQLVHEIEEIVVATTSASEDDPLDDFVRRLGFATFRGSQDDVLSRYWGAAQLVDAAHIVRITSDCPLLAPTVSALVVRRYLTASAPLDYCSNTVERTYPRGLDTEVFSIEALARAHSEATAPPEREHVTPYFYRNPDRFKIGQVTDGVDRSWHRWTLDTDDDYAFIRKLYVALGQTADQADYTDLLSLVERHPEWQLLNAHVQQKQYGD